MPIYETVFIARQDLSEAQIQSIIDGCSEIIKKEDGKILKTENWGLRTLAYRIKKNRKGHYVLIESDTPPAAILEMERTMRLNEDIMRYMTIRLEEPSKGASAIIEKNKDSDYEKEAA